MLRLADGSSYSPPVCAIEVVPPKLFAGATKLFLRHDDRTTGRVARVVQSLSRRSIIDRMPRPSGMSFLPGLPIPTIGVGGEGRGV